MYAVKTRAGANLLLALLLLAFLVHVAPLRTKKKEHAAGTTPREREAQCIMDALDRNEDGDVSIEDVLAFAEESVQVQRKKKLKQQITRLASTNLANTVVQSCKNLGEGGDMKESNHFVLEDSHSRHRQLVSVQSECVPGGTVSTNQTCTFDVIDNTSYSCVSPGVCENGLFSNFFVSRCRHMECEEDSNNVSSCACFFRDDSELRDELDVLWSDPLSSNDLCGEIEEWRTGNVTDMSFLFYDINMSFSLTGWDTSKVTDMAVMFYQSLQFEGAGVSEFNTSRVTDMSYIFAGTPLYNADISGWDVSKVTSMEASFFNSVSFDSSLNDWDVSRVQNMDSMFRGALGFRGSDGGLAQWNTASVTTLSSMFEGAAAFDGSNGVEGWNTSAVLAMDGLFKSAIVFDGDVSTWDTSSVTTLKDTFRGAVKFNGDVSRWDVASVETLEGTFASTEMFEGDLSLWNTKSVTTLKQTFYGVGVFEGAYSLREWDTSRVLSLEDTFFFATNFNGNIENWNTSKVTTIKRTFTHAELFNGNISAWDTSRVQDMTRTFFQAGKFEASDWSNLGDWDTSKVTGMERMFYFATAFTGHGIHRWTASSLRDMEEIFYGAVKFDADLASWNVSRVDNFESAFEYATDFSECHRSQLSTKWSYNDAFKTVYSDPWSAFGCTCDTIESHLPNGAVGASEGCDPETLLDTGENQFCWLECDVGYAPSGSVGNARSKTGRELAWCPQDAIDGDAPETNLTCEVAVASIQIDCVTMFDGSCDVGSSISESPSLFRCMGAAAEFVVGSDQKVGTMGGDMIRFANISMPQDLAFQYETVAKNSKRMYYYLEVDGELHGDACSFELWKNKTTLSCSFPMGVGVGHGIALLRSDGHKTGLLNGCEFDYAGPKIAELSVCTDADRCDRRGGDLLTIRGRDFGPSQALVFINGRVCANLTHGEDHEHCASTPTSDCHQVLRCVVPALNIASSETNSIVVIAGAQYVWRYDFRYDQCDLNFFQAEEHAVVEGETRAVYGCSECAWGKTSSELDAVSCSACTLVYIGSKSCDVPVLGFVIIALAVVFALVLFCFGYRSWSKQKKKAQDVHWKNFREKIVGYHRRQTAAVEDYVENFEKRIRNADSTHSFQIQCDDLTILEPLHGTDGALRWRGELDLPMDKGIPVVVKSLKCDGSFPTFDESVVRTLHILSCHPRMLFVYGYCNDPESKISKWSLVTEFAYCGLDRVLWTSTEGRPRKESSSYFSSRSTVALLGHKGRRAESNASESGALDINGAVDGRSDLLRWPSWEERVRWACDIAEALAWLKASGHVHGRLTSMACKLSFESNNMEEKGGGDDVDDTCSHRRRAKIGGLSIEKKILFWRRRSRRRLSRTHSVSFFHKITPKKASSNGQRHKKVAENTPWVAPELLGQENAASPVASKNDDDLKNTTSSNSPADVYALGVIMSEMYALRRPWPGRWKTGDARSDRSIRHLVKRGGRPELSVQSSAPNGFYHLIALCWRQNALHRPQASVVARKLKEILNGECHSRKYSSHRTLRRRRTSSRGFATTTILNLFADADADSTRKRNALVSRRQNRAASEGVEMATPFPLSTIRRRGDEMQGSEEKADSDDDDDDDEMLNRTKVCTSEHYVVVDIERRENECNDDDKEERESVSRAMIENKFYLLLLLFSILTSRKAAVVPKGKVSDKLDRTTLPSALSNNADRTKEKIQCLADVLDRNNDGAVSIEDFVDLVLPEIELSKKKQNYVRERLENAVQSCSNMYADEDAIDSTFFEAVHRRRRSLAEENGLICRDIDYRDVKDSRNERCATGYGEHETGSCGMFNDADFDSDHLCCDCGGGRLENCTVLSSQAQDSQGNGCDFYDEDPGKCGLFDDGSFTASVFCCGCGGGKNSRCVNNDNNGALKDSNGYTCKDYDLHLPSFKCGLYDDADFSAIELCCKCGGGSACVDGDGASNGDSDGDFCVGYTQNPNWCGGRYDDDDFSADEMCCACGGGAGSTCSVPPLPRGSYQYDEPECVPGGTVENGQVCTFVATSDDYRCVSLGQCSGGLFSTQLKSRCRRIECYDPSNSSTCGCFFYDKAELRSEFDLFSRDVPASNDVCNGIGRWRTDNVTDMSHLFEGSNLTFSLTNWNTSKVTNMDGMFREFVGTVDGVSDFDTSSVTSMVAIFDGAVSFDADISRWDVSKVTSMESAFHSSTLFNSPLNSWDVSRVKNMFRMFKNASSFQGVSGGVKDWNTASANNLSSMFEDAILFDGNDGLDKWNTNNVLSMDNLFSGAIAFNGNISTWNTSNVADMKCIFSRASVFNCDVSGWNTASVLSFEEAFHAAVKFERNISLWDTRSITSLRKTFQNAVIFGESAWDLNAWDTSRVLDMTATFRGAARFCGRIGSWNTVRVETMELTFAGASKFDGNLSSWNTTRVRNMNEMFLNAEKFTGGMTDIASWDTSKVTTMSSTFRFATRFTGSNIGRWKTNSVSNMEKLFFGAVNFNADLASWNVQRVTNFDFAFEYATEFTECHKSLLSKSWTFNTYFQNVYAEPWSAYGCTCASIELHMPNGAVGALGGCDVDTKLDTGENKKCALECDIGRAPKDAVDRLRTRASLATCPSNATDGVSPHTNLTCEIGLSTIQLDCITLLSHGGCDERPVTSSSSTLDVPSLYECASPIDSFVMGLMQTVGTAGGDMMRFTNVSVPLNLIVIHGDTARNSKSHTYALEIDGEISGKLCTFDMWQHSNTLSCPFPPGVGTEHTLSLMRSDGHKTGLLSNCMFDYAPPVIESLSVCTNALRCDRHGGDTLTIRGRHFGQNHALVFINGRVCQNIQHGEEMDECYTANADSCHQVLRCVVPALDIASSESNSMVVIAGAQYVWMYEFRYKQCEKNFFQSKISVTNYYSSPSNALTNVSTIYDCEKCDWGKSAGELDAVSCVACTLIYYGSEHCEEPILGYIIVALVTIVATTLCCIGYRSWSKQKKRAQEVHWKNFREKILGYHQKQTSAVEEFVENFEKSIRCKEMTHTFKIDCNDLVKKERLEAQHADGAERWRGELDLPTDKGIPVTVKALVCKNGNFPSFDEDVVRALHVLSCHPRMMFVYGYSSDPKANTCKWALVTAFAYCGLDRVLWSSNPSSRSRTGTRFFGNGSLDARLLAKRRSDSNASETNSSHCDDHHAIASQSELLRVPSWHERVRWACDIAEALAWIKASGYVHGRLTSMACKLSIHCEEDDSGSEGGNNDGAGESGDTLSYRRRVTLGDLAMEKNILIDRRRKLRRQLQRSDRSSLTAGAKVVSKISRNSSSPLNRFVTSDVPWLAPELLCANSADRDIDAVVNTPSCAADVYALGMVMSEMYALRKPWPGHWKEGSAKAGRVVASLVKRGQRPSLSVQASAPLGFYHLIMLCWRQNTLHRPQASVLTRKLTEIMNGKSHTRNFASHRRLKRRKSSSKSLTASGLLSFVADAVADAVVTEDDDEEEYNGSTFSRMRRSTSRTRGSTKVLAAHPPRLAPVAKPTLRRRESSSAQQGLKGAGGGSERKGITVEISSI
eukprot:g514.t1